MYQWYKKDRDLIFCESELSKVNIKLKEWVESRRVLNLKITVAERESDNADSTNFLKEVNYLVTLKKCLQS